MTLIVDDDMAYRAERLRPLLAATGGTILTLGARLTVDPEHPKGTLAAGAAGDASATELCDEDRTRGWLAQLPTHFSLLERLALEHPHTVLVGHQLDIALKVVEETFAKSYSPVACCTVIMQPWAMRSVGEQPSSFAGMTLSATTPAALQAAAYRAVVRALRQAASLCAMLGQDAAEEPAGTPIPAHAVRRLRMLTLMLAWHRCSTSFAVALPASAQ